MSFSSQLQRETAVTMATGRRGLYIASRFTHSSRRRRSYGNVRNALAHAETCSQMVLQADAVLKSERRTYTRAQTTDGGRTDRRTAGVINATHTVTTGFLTPHAPINPARQI